MSRMTAAQIIGLGEYLNPDFDPGTLTVPQLLGVLGFHNIKFPSPYNKPKLIQLFNDEIKPRASKFKKERAKKENSHASDDGIMDGLTGKPIGGQKITLVRRSSRRLSRAPTQDQGSPPVRPDPPKRRRSSAQPNLGGPPRKEIQTQPTLQEESELEEDELPIRKVGRNNKNSDAAGSQARRVSQTAGDDSGWEDNNIFQSGAESSSPTRPSPLRPKATRKSVGPRKSRKSASAPPQLHPFINDIDPRYSPPQSKFEPDLPPNVSYETRVVTTRSPFASDPSAWEPQIKDDGSHYDELNLRDGVVSEINGIHGEVLEDVKEEGSQEFEQDDESESEDQTVAVSARIAEGVKVIRRSQKSVPTGSKPTPLILRLLFAIIVLATSGAIFNFKMESAPIGYCDTGRKTNAALEELNAKWSAVEECNRENRTLQYLASLSRYLPGANNSEAGDVDSALCPPPPLLYPLPHPRTCTPCPDHATCNRHTVTCDTGYLLRPHPILFFLPPPPDSLQETSLVPLDFSSPAELVWKVVSVATDGLPGLGSVAFPPWCMEDPKRKRNIGALGKAVEKVLGQERGKRVCTGVDISGVPEAEGGEAKRWGVEVEKLKETLRGNTKAHLISTFDDMFNEAIQQLIHWGGVVIGEDLHGKRYLAHKTADLTWNCAIIVKLREVWAEWRATAIGVVVLIGVIIFGRARRAQQIVESKRVAELVQIALDTLRNQELAHHTDPVTAPQPYLSSLQLRDLILQDEHSIPLRRRLWDRVEHVVEGNANVRANLEEVSGGDELRVWRWVGSAGRGADVRRKVESDGGGWEGIVM